MLYDLRIEESRTKTYKPLRKISPNVATLKFKMSVDQKVLISKVRTEPQTGADTFIQPTKDEYLD